MSPLEVTVHVNRGSATVLETEVGTVETCEPIELVLQGHDAPAHVHVRVDDPLDRVTSIEGDNYYVEPDDVTAVPIAVDPSGIDDAIEGTLEIVAGYGAETIQIPVTVTDGPPAVDVDDSLAEPSRSPPEQTPVQRAVDEVTALAGVDTGTLAVFALGLLAIVIATATAATIGGAIAFAGLAIVVAGVAVGLGLLLR